MQHSTEGSPTAASIMAPPGWLAAAGAALMEQGHRVDGLSRLLTVAALLLGPFAPSHALVVLGVVVVAGLLELYLAVRVGFDAALFRLLGGSPDLASMDLALMQLGLLPARKAGRPLVLRLAGARRLLNLQGIALLVQVAGLLAVIVFRR